MRAALSLWWRLRRAGAGEDRVPGVLAIVSFAVASASLLVCVAGLTAFEARNTTPPGAGVGGLAVDAATIGDLYVTLAWIATTCMVIPILTLGGVAARLAIARRDQRLAALRLAGGTTGQVTLMTLAEAAAQALVGALVGVVLYVAVLPLVARLTFQGRAFDLGELLLPLWKTGLVVAAVVVVAVLSGASSLARVAVSPLGVAARTSPKRLSLLRLLVAAAAGAAWVLVITPMKEPDRVVIVLVLGAMILAVNAVGPWVVMVAGRLAARVAPTATTLLAARRIADDPKSTWRAVGALGLAVVVTGFTSLTVVDDPTPGLEQYLAADLGTGAFVTLAIITVVGATSTGVVQAARVLDQRDQYRALALAGTGQQVLHRARALEVALPLAVTIALSAGFVLVLILPFSSHLDGALVVRFVVTSVLAGGVVLASVLASRSLVRTASRAA
ncbi:FtsX-like permease family protein [Intrasporangium sp. YIM S08009]|uniref:FtsX-like permease family protein n=1 Tax=Intrasporangium zincisolvens TaxID=3080018 RepID=UPI002B056029|nr:FtsX-like permease family protein [Intrasporangium sp. YIM S08009]